MQTNPADHIRTMLLFFLVQTPTKQLVTKNDNETHAAKKTLSAIIHVYTAQSWPSSHSQPSIVSTHY